MLRDEHNKHWQANRQPDDEVCSLTYGGKLGQYDPDCSRCWLGYGHDWDHHDKSIRKAREQREEYGKRQAA